VDPTREPGIRLTNIIVEHLRFDDVAAGAPKPAVQFAVHIERRLSESDPSGEVTVQFALRPEEGETPQTFVLEVSLSGRFEADATAPNMQLEEFLKVNGPAMLMPFIRELVANVTTRSRYGTVLLPAINVVELVRREETTAK